MAAAPKKTTHNLAVFKGLVKDHGTCNCCTVHSKYVWVLRARGGEFRMCSNCYTELKAQIRAQLQTSAA